MVVPSRARTAPPESATWSLADASSPPNTNIDVKTVASPPGGGLACITGRASALDEAPSGWSGQLQRLLVLEAQAHRQAFLADRRRWKDAGSLVRIPFWLQQLRAKMGEPEPPYLSISTDLGRL